MNPVWKMNKFERFEEQRRRLNFLTTSLNEMGGDAVLIEETIHLKTEKNNYFLDVAPFEPRMIKISLVYEVNPGDLDMASWACYNASTVTHAVKSRADRYEQGYRLTFFAEIFVDQIETITNVISLYIAAIEDCREKYIEFFAHGAEQESLTWSHRP